MKILITGGAGFIGSHLADRYLREGWSVRVMDSLQPRVHPDGIPKHLSRDVEFIKGDVRNRSDWEKALAGVNIVSHQAAYQDYVPDYSEFSLTNVVGTALLFEVIKAKKLPVERVIFASSQAVYGEGQYSCNQHGFMLPEPRSTAQLEQCDWEVRCSQCGEVVQPMLLDERYANPLSPYGVSKYAQEITALRLGAQTGVPCVALRYSITQGARQSLFNQYSGIARIFTLQLLRDQRPLAFEDGLLQRDYVHVDDVVEANWVVTRERKADGQVYNVGSGVPTTVIEYARKLAEAMGKSMEPKISRMFRMGDARHSVSSVAKLSQLGWSARRSLGEIIQDFLAWVSTQGSLDHIASNAHRELIEMKVLRTAAG